MQKASFSREFQLWFWSKVEKTESCWEWQAAKTRDGYGRIFDNETPGYSKLTILPAHRVSYVLANGSIPQGKLICHKCGNRSCVRPSHIYAGTIKENMRDRKAHGRQAEGERNGWAKLTEDKVKLIRWLVNYGSRRKIAKILGLHHSTVKSVVSRKTWKHVR